jgi:uncharacterized protein involved in exopolysaccharide biosynthesis
MSDRSDAYEEFEDEAIGLPAQLRDPMGVLRRQVRWVGVSLVLFLAITAAVTAVFPLKYEAKATVLLTSKSIPDEYVPTTSLAGIFEQFETIRGEVFSRESLSRIITATGLYADEVDSKPMAALATRLGQEVTIESVGGGGGGRHAPSSVAFDIRLAGKDPELLARVVNRIVADLINENVEYRSRQARVTTQFMQREFDRADAALREHERKLAQFRSEHRGALPDEEATTLSKLERLEEQRRSAILRISELRSRIERIEARPDAVSTNETLDDLRRRLREARAVYTEDHPNVLSLERQVAAMEGREPFSDPAARRQGNEEIATIEESIRREQSRLDQIDAEVQELESRLDMTPKIADDYAALVREEQILQENYVDYLRKLKNAELSLSLESAQQGAQLTRMDAALPPTSPVIPRWMVAAAGVGASIVLALGVGVLRELLHPVIIDEDHLEATIPIPCIGSISEIA